MHAAEIKLTCKQKKAAGKASSRVAVEVGKTKTGKYETEMSMVTSRPLSTECVDVCHSLGRCISMW